MNGCPGCKAPLNESLYALDNGVEYKSCPRCSENAGHHIFYKSSYFGIRDMGDGRSIIQSYCPSCRAGQHPAIAPSFTCL